MGSSLRWLGAVAFLITTSCAPASREAARRGNTPHVPGAASSPGAPTLLPASAVTSPPGNPLSWQYAYNRNALLASTAVGAHRVALTRAGHLLVFDRDQRLVSELLAGTAATCLTAISPTDVLVGYDDGTIERVSIPRLARQVVNRGPARVEWIGGGAGSTGPVAVFGEPRSDATARGEPRFTVRALNTNVDTVVRPASAFLLDAQGQLWLGSNPRYTSATLDLVEPEAGRVSSVAVPNGSGIHGIAEVGDEVWVYGGGSHLLTVYASISRVWPGPPTLLYDHGASPVSGPVDLKQTPTLPIRHLVPSGDRVLVLAENHLFESDRTLAHWSFRGRLAAPDARSDLEEDAFIINAVDVEAERMLLTTGLDGLVEYSNGRSASHALPGQMPIAPFRALPSRDGLLLLTGWGRDPFVAIDRHGWTPAKSLLPPLPAASAGGEAPRWCRMWFFPNPGGAIGAIARFGLPSGNCADENAGILSAASSAGRFEERHREVMPVDPTGAFALPDGTPAVTSQHDVLWNLDGPRFRRLDSDGNLDDPSHLGRSGTGWLVLDRGHVMQLELSPSRELQLQPVGDLHGAFDAGRISERELVVTDQWGIWTFDLQSQRRRPLLAHPAPDRIDAVEVDQRGRIWALGEHLYVIQAPGQAMTIPLPFARPLPPNHWSRERALSVSGAFIVVPLFERGLLVLDADATAAAAQTSRAP